MNEFWKKVVVVCIIIVLAIPLVFFIGNNFKKRIEGVDSQEFFEKIPIDEINDIIEQATTTTAN